MVETAIMREGCIRKVEGVAMNDNPYESPNAAGRPPKQVKSRLVRGLVVVLTVLGVIGILVAVLLPARRGSTEAARRMSCVNNLKRIAIALHHYEDVHNCLPPAYTVDAQGKPLHSWRTLILPYLEQQALYETIDLTKPWDDPVNKEAYDTALPVYVCRSADCPRSHTTYHAILCPTGCFQPTQPRQLSEITDDIELTLMVLEVDSEHAVHWMSPTDASEQWLLNLGNDTRLPHPGVAPAVCVGGNVLVLTPTLGAEQIQALISIDGGDDAVAQEAY
jgi:hypothetical protein